MYNDDIKTRPKWVNMVVVDGKEVDTDIYSITAASIDGDIIIDFITNDDSIERGYKFTITFDWD